MSEGLASHAGPAWNEVKMTSVPVFLKWLPVAALTLWLALICTPSTYPLVTESFYAHREYTVIEIATAFGLLAASVVALRLSILLARRAGHGMLSLLFLGFSAAAALVCLEEVQWGQPILGFEIPAWMLEANELDQFTLHNIGQMHMNSEILYAVFCALGAILYLRRLPFLPDRLWQHLRAEPALTPLLLCVAVIAVLKAWNDIVGNPFDHGMPLMWTGELAELFIAIWLLAYVSLKTLRLAPPPEPVRTVRHQVAAGVRGR